MSDLATYVVPLTGRDLSKPVRIPINGLPDCQIGFDFLFTSQAELAEGAAKAFTLTVNCYLVKEEQKVGMDSTPLGQIKDTDLGVPNISHAQFFHMSHNSLHVGRAYGHFFLQSARSVKVEVVGDEVVVEIDFPRELNQSYNLRATLPVPK